MMTEAAGRNQAGVDSPAAFAYDAGAGPRRRSGADKRSVVYPVYKYFKILE
ncbi:MAG: hypothetical protein HGA94_02705 [Candidatus Aminicenantes bacterium]|nr:hypothetical protein [Candidatus Aminicenantes bacterium]NTV80244.1 hypothetical protein [Candidatus Aminicenantes bacterium]